jgi:hypothetical protein
LLRDNAVAAWSNRRVIYRGMCTLCSHLHESEGHPDHIHTCDAFPEGVPGEILHSGFDHRQPFEGDNGIRFSPDGPTDVDYIERVLENARRTVERWR